MSDPHTSMAFIPGSGPSDLIDRIRAGDREAAAAFVMTYGPRIRWRVRHQLGARMRRVFDSQEILSTVARRLDQYVCGQTLSTISGERLWALVVRITENAVADKVRIQRRLERVESGDERFAHELSGGIDEAERTGDADASEFIARAMGAVTDPVDRSILNMWLNGYTLGEIGASVGLSAKAVEWRWRRVKERLHEVLSPRVGS